MAEKKREISFKGIATSPGVAHGPAFLYLNKDLEIPTYRISDSTISLEKERFAQALVQTRQQLTAIRADIAAKLGEKEAEIFDAHLLVLEDEALISETLREMEQSKYNIEICFRKVFRRYIDFFSQLDDEYLRERALDVKDVGRRVLRNLIGDAGLNQNLLTESHVLVVDDLTPSETANLDKKKIIAIVTNAGGKTSHSAIMARSLGFPAVAGIGDISDFVENDDVLLVDGFEGLVIIHPSEATLLRYGKIELERKNIEKIFRSSIHLESKMLDGRPFCLQANIDDVSDIPAVLESGAEGVGLLRTENIFLKRESFPDEEEQFEIYREIAEKLKPYSVTIRTLDIGGDKNVTDSRFRFEETNPFLGERGIRLCLSHPDLFKKQLRAILRASAFGNIQIMYPMISSLNEVLAANRLLEECRQELLNEGKTFSSGMKIGVMIEVPSAVLIADTLAQYCDFFSIGSNDLIQYILAVDRLNSRVAHLYSPTHPAVVKAFNMIMDAAKRSDTPVSICGEVAADPIYTAYLYGAGVTSLSTSPRALPEKKYLMRSLSSADLEKLCSEIAEVPDQDKLIDTLQAFYDKTIDRIMSH